VLLYGPPGTGKTCLAKAVATESHRTFFNVTAATVAKLDPEKLIAALFGMADEMAPSTIFFDEIGFLMSQRGSLGEGEAGRKMKTQILAKLEAMDGLGDRVAVLAATSFPWDLDEALLRRFQKRVYVPLPDIMGRKALLEMYLRDLADLSLDFDEWAQRLEGYSCANIARLCRDAEEIAVNRRAELFAMDDWMQLSLSDSNIAVTDEIFQIAAAKRKSSVDSQSIRRYEEWRRVKGAE
jgi:katanin p60 ATPase-containing subunit A1